MERAQVDAALGLSDSGVRVLWGSRAQVKEDVMSEQLRRKGPGEEDGQRLGESVSAAKACLRAARVLLAAAVFGAREHKLIDDISTSLNISHSPFWV